MINFVAFAVGEWSHAWRCSVFVGDYPPQFVAHEDIRLTMVRRPQDSPVTVSTLQPMS
jgi:hypothetical protein